MEFHLKRHLSVFALFLMANSAIISADIIDYIPGARFAQNAYNTAQATQQFCQDHSGKIALGSGLLIGAGTMYAITPRDSNNSFPIVPACIAGSALGFSAYLYYRLHRLEAKVDGNHQTNMAAHGTTQGQVANLTEGQKAIAEKTEEIDRKAGMTLTALDKQDQGLATVQTGLVRFADTFDQHREEFEQHRKSNDRKHSETHQVLAACSDNIIAVKDDIKELKADISTLKVVMHDQYAKVNDTIKNQHNDLSGQIAELDKKATQGFKELNKTMQTGIQTLLHNQNQQSSRMNQQQLPALKQSALAAGFLSGSNYARSAFNRAALSHSQNEE